MPTLDRPCPKTTWAGGGSASPVTIDEETLTGHPGRALTNPASQASLLVVGSHHRHGLRALLHGSVSQAVMHHATCPWRSSRSLARNFPGAVTSTEGCLVLAGDRAADGVARQSGGGSW
ncbi:universal stress protein [Nonomuraea spiralis]|uniref:universal stress protein n=1 Tax=Nonomuraea spiralis TaxID=46182 RepID=UPI0037B20AAE